MIPSALNIMAFAFPWAALALRSIRFKRIRLATVAVFSLVGTYTLLLLAVHVLNAEIAANLSSYDLNRDGGFSGSEISPEQQKAMEDFTNDTGRNMAPIIGALLSLAYVTVVFTLWLVSAWIGSTVLKNCVRRTSI